MVINTPFIHLLKSRYGYYFYDVNKNDIVNISEDMYKYLFKLIINDNNYINLHTLRVRDEEEVLKSNGYLKIYHPNIIEMPETDNIGYYLNYRLEQLTLQVTQQCNFRCRYCPYTVGDDQYYHTHKSNNMSWETAKKAIDFFALRTRDTSKINIGFYGGEPLLEYGLIKKCIKYCNEIFEGKIISYALTTNASVLSVEKTKFLIDNNAHIQISLDGPKEIHDKNRKYAADGRGTFDDIYRNLKKIKIELPHNYYEKINFNTVIDPINDCSKINDFFENELFSDNIVKQSLLETFNKNKLYYSQEFIDNNKNDYLIALLAKSDFFDISQINKMSYNYYKAFEAFENKLKIVEKLPNKIGHNGPCKPGIFKLFVSTDGDLFPCEKLKDNSDVLKIGTIVEGFNIEKIKEIYNIGHLKDNACKNCWNIIYCNICVTKVNDGEKISSELYDSECIKACKESENNIKRIIALSEVKEMIKNNNYASCISLQNNNDLL